MGFGPILPRQLAAPKNSPTNNRTPKAKTEPNTGTVQKRTNPADTAKNSVNKGERQRLAGIDMGIRQESYKTVSGAAQAYPHRAVQQDRIK